MAATKLYPIGIQTFERIRQENRLYIDKTQYVYRLTHTSSAFVFLSRPRRFGKSLLVSTLENYFEGRKELFDGLAIENLEKEWAVNPVLHFDLSGGKHQNEEQLTRYLDSILKENENKFGICSQDIDPNMRLNHLIQAVYQKTGKRVVVLIDEYDAPLLDVVHNNEQLEKMRNIMRNFYSPLKKCEGMLRFVFLTGITKFSQLSIFSELNNITNISMQEEYAGICGITKEELLTQMSEDIDMLADKLSLSREDTIEKLTCNYDGYHFTWPSPDVFNPYSLLNCFAERKFGAYWFGSGTPTFLIEMMRKFKTLPYYLASGTDEGRVVIAHMSAYINRGDIDGALHLLQEFLETVPYCDNTQHEGHYQQTLYIIFALLTDYRIIVEQRTAKGCTDLTLETHDHIFIIEVKFDHSAQEALQQINDKRYADAFALKGKTIVKVGINFSVEKEHNITDWVTE